MDACSSPDGRPTAFLVTCEHGGNRVPPVCRLFFAGQEALLQSHRGYDPGALAMAREMAKRLQAPLVLATTSRLVVDLNRSIGHPRLYSEAMQQAPKALRDEVLAKYYWPYRRQAEAIVAEAVAAGRRLVHVSSHSFTPALDGEVRNADIGLLYDPGRPGEAALAQAWHQALASLAPQFRVRRNYPYTGKSDGFCAGLRRRFPPEAYVGVELEINHKHVLAGGGDWQDLRRLVPAALGQALLAPPGPAGTTAL